MIPGRKGGQRTGAVEPADHREAAPAQTGSVTFEAPTARGNPHMRIRPAGPEDAPTVLSLFDDAVAWLVSRGLDGQWGTEPWSQDPARVERVRGLASEGLWIAELPGAAGGTDPVGALTATEEPPDYAPGAGERELYIHMLLASRSHPGRRIGSLLLDHAREQARARGISLVRVDCWSGGDGALIRYYEHQGFTPTERASVGGREVQVFETRV